MSKNTNALDWSDWLLFAIIALMVIAALIPWRM